MKIYGFPIFTLLKPPQQIPQLKKPTLMHLYCCNKAITFVKPSEVEIFHSKTNFKKIEIYLYFICQPACLPACLPACRKTHQHQEDRPSFFSKRRLSTRYHRSVVPMKIYPLRHVESFNPSLFLFLFYLLAKKVRKTKKKVSMDCHGFCLIRHTKIAACT